MVFFLWDFHEAPHFEKYPTNLCKTILNDILLAITRSTSRTPRLQLAPWVYIVYPPTGNCFLGTWPESNLKLQMFGVVLFGVYHAYLVGGFKPFEKY